MTGKHLANKHQTDSLPVRFSGKEGTEELCFRLFCYTGAIIYHFNRGRSDCTDYNPTLLDRSFGCMFDAFRSIPAGKSVHHSFVSGLLMHTYNMLQIADFLSGLYAEIIDRSLLLTGTLLHDFAKDSQALCELSAFSLTARGALLEIRADGKTGFAWCRGGIRNET